MELADYLRWLRRRRAWERCPARRPRSSTTRSARSWPPASSCTERWVEIVTAAHEHRVCARAPRSCTGTSRTRRTSGGVTSGPASETSRNRPAASPSSCRLGFIHRAQTDLFQNHGSTRGATMPEEDLAPASRSARLFLRPLDPEHPDLLGEDGPQAGAGGPHERCQRFRRHADGGVDQQFGGIRSTATTSRHRTIEPSDRARWAERPTSARRPTAAGSSRARRARSRSPLLDAEQPHLASIAGGY